MKSFFVAALLIASPAVAQPNSGSEPANSNATQTASQAGSSEAGERRICRRVEDASGSRVAARRVCMTAQEWREQDRNIRN